PEIAPTIGFFRFLTALKTSNAIRRRWRFILLLSLVVPLGADHADEARGSHGDLSHRAAGVCVALVAADAKAVTDVDGDVIGHAAVAPVEDQEVAGLGLRPTHAGALRPRKPRPRVGG